MKPNTAILLPLAAALTFGCAEMGTLGGTQFGETQGKGSASSVRPGVPE